MTERDETRTKVSRRKLIAALTAAAAEGETASAIWIRFRAGGPGTTAVAYALTRGERSHAYAARTFVVKVRA
jgi:hypothetical protein